MLSRNSNLKLQSTIAAVVGSVCCGFSAQAEVTPIPHAAAGYEYNSNIFLVPDTGAPRVDSDGTARLEDKSYSYSGGLDLAGSWQENKLTFNSDIKKTQYTHFDRLNRVDQLYGLSFDWVATRKIDGRLNARYDRHLTPFTDFGNLTGIVPDASVLTQTNRSLGLGVNYHMTSQWQTLTEGAYTLSSIPTSATNETTDVQDLYTKAGIKYTGKARLSWSLSASRNDGKYVDDSSTIPDYRTTHYESAVNYEVGPKTRADFNIGYTKYAQSGLDTSGTVGGLGISYQISNKTSMYVRYDQSINAYPTTQGSQKSSTWSSGLRWQMLTKLSLVASYARTKATITGDNLGTTAPSRDDQLESAQASLDYAIQSWLSVSTYYRYQKRTSDVADFIFDNNIYGINLVLRRQ